MWDFFFGGYKYTITLQISKILSNCPSRPELLRIHLNAYILQQILHFTLRIIIDWPRTFFINLVKPQSCFKSLWMYETHGCLTVILKRRRCNKPFQTNGSTFLPYKQIKVQQKVEAEGAGSRLLVAIHVAALTLLQRHKSGPSAF